MDVCCNVCGSEDVTPKCCGNCQATRCFVCYILVKKCDKDIHMNQCLNFSEATFETTGSGNAVVAKLPISKPHTTAPIVVSASSSPVSSTSSPSDGSVFTVSSTDSSPSDYSSVATYASSNAAIPVSNGGRSVCSSLTVSSSGSSSANGADEYEGFGDYGSSVADSFMAGTSCTSSDTAPATTAPRRRPSPTRLPRQSVNINGEETFVGDQVYFRRLRDGFQEKGKLLSLEGNDMIKIRYESKAWAYPQYDEVHAVKDVGGYMPRRRVKQEADDAAYAAKLAAQWSTEDKVLAKNMKKAKAKPVKADKANSSDKPTAPPAKRRKALKKEMDAAGYSDECEYPDSNTAAVGVADGDEGVDSSSGIVRHQLLGNSAVTTTAKEPCLSLKVAVRRWKTSSSALTTSSSSVIPSVASSENSGDSKVKYGVECDSSAKISSSSSSSGSRSNGAKSSSTKSSSSSGIAQSDNKARTKGGKDPKVRTMQKEKAVGSKKRSKREQLQEDEEDSDDAFFENREDIYDNFWPECSTDDLLQYLTFTDEWDHESDVHHRIDSSVQRGLLYELQHWKDHPTQPTASNSTSLSTNSTSVEPSYWYDMVPVAGLQGKDIEDIITFCPTTAEEFSKLRCSFMMETMPSDYTHTSPASMIPILAVINDYLTTRGQRVNPAVTVSMMMQRREAYEVLLSEEPQPWPTVPHSAADLFGDNASKESALRKLQLSLPLSYHHYCMVWEMVCSDMGGLGNIEEKGVRGSTFVHSNTSGKQEKTMYGAVEPNLVQEMINRSRLKQSGVFMDIGSGIGQVLLQTAATVGCKSVGIEIGKDRHDKAVELVKQFDQTLENLEIVGRISELVSLHNNCFEADDVADLIFGSNVIYFNNFGSWFDGRLEGCFSTLVKDYRMLNGTQIFSFAPFEQIQFFMLPPVVFDTPHEATSWNVKVLKMHHFSKKSDWQCNHCARVNEVGITICECGKAARTKRVSHAAISKKRKFD